jgi:hypothetical protein
MTMNEAEILFEEARSKRELVRFLAGYPEYAIQSTFADVPTDAGAVFSAFRGKIVEDGELREEVLDAVQTLAADPEYGWMALDYLVHLRLVRQYQGVDLLQPGYVEEIATRIRANKEQLTACKKWHGKNLHNGVWGMVQSLNHVLADDHDLIVLPEEL